MVTAVSPSHPRAFHPTRRIAGGPVLIGQRREPCPRCGLVVLAVEMMDHALRACTRNPASSFRAAPCIMLSGGRPSSQHDECAD